MADTFEPGDPVRLTHPWSVAEKGDVGRLLTVRGIGYRGQYIVDDGDPANPDLTTNGWRLAMHAPADVLEAVRESAGGDL